MNIPHKKMKRMHTQLRTHTLMTISKPKPRPSGQSPGQQEGLFQLPTMNQSVTRTINLSWTVKRNKIQDKDPIILSFRPSCKAQTPKPKEETTVRLDNLNDLEGMKKTRNKEKDDDQ